MELLTFVLVSIAVIAVPGPNVLVVVSTSLGHGRTRGLQTVAGTSTAMIIQLILAAVGTTWFVSALSQGDIQKLTDVFVTHMHIDHFIGFDLILRSLLRRERPLRVFGPPGITGCVEGKLAGYSWNLIHEYPKALIHYLVNFFRIEFFSD